MIQKTINIDMIFRPQLVSVGLMGENNQYGKGGTDCYQNMEINSNAINPTTRVFLHKLKNNVYLTKSLCVLPK